MFPKKVYSTLFGRFKFSNQRYCCSVTKIYTHYKFEQARFKRDCVLMNQKSRQNAKNAPRKTSGHC